MPLQKPSHPAFTVFLGMLLASLLAHPVMGEEIDVRDSFENLKQWEPTDPTAWKVKETKKGNVYSQFKKRSEYKPPHRSPLNISWRKEPVLSDFQLDVEVLSTHPDYGHRDACLFFGFQDPGHFYYVHLGKKTDDHANQIFIVNGKARSKISTKTTPGTNWDDKWHHVRIVRKVSDGTIAVYFDDMKTPVMTAQDATFKTGRIGLGSFDDTTDWRNLQLKGKQAKATK